jgi:hypothetical protein
MWHLLLYLNLHVLVTKCPIFRMNEGEVQDTEQIGYIWGQIVYMLDALNVKTKDML